MSRQPVGILKNKLKLNRRGKLTRDVATQVGKWLQLKEAIEKDEALRAYLMKKVEKIMAQTGYPEPNELTPEATHLITDLTLKFQPIDFCEWET